MYPSRDLLVEAHQIASLISYSQYFEVCFKHDLFVFWDDQLADLKYWESHFYHLIWLPFSTIALNYFDRSSYQVFDPGCVSFVFGSGSDFLVTMHSQFPWILNPSFFSRTYHASLQNLNWYQSFDFHSIILVINSCELMFFSWVTSYLSPNSHRGHRMVPNFSLDSEIDYEFLSFLHCFWMGRRCWVHELVSFWWFELWDLTVSFSSFVDLFHLIL